MKQTVSYRETKCFIRENKSETAWCVKLFSVHGGDCKSVLFEKAGKLSEYRFHTNNKTVSITYL